MMLYMLECTRQCPKSRCLIRSGREFETENPREGWIAFGLGQYRKVDSGTVGQSPVYVSAYTLYT